MIEFMTQVGELKILDDIIFLSLPSSLSSSLSLRRLECMKLCAVWMT